MTNVIDELLVERDIMRLNQTHGGLIDDDRLEEWPDLFTDDGKYIIQTRENLDAGLNGGYWMYHTSKQMIRDRVISLLHVNHYNKHYYRHFISNQRIVETSNDVYSVRSNFLVVQTDFEGKTESISAGEYKDKILLHNGEFKFVEKFVIADTFHLPTMVIMPL